MKKKNKLTLIALSVLAMVFGAVIPNFNLNPVIVPRKPGIFINQQTVETYNLSDAAKERIKDSVVLYVGSPDALVNGIPRSIDVINPQVVPIIRNNEAYVPAGFIAEALGAQVSRDAGTAAMIIKSGSYTISFAAGQNKVSVNGVQRFLPSPAFTQYGETYIHLPSICEILGRNDYYYSNVIIVSPKNQNIDLSKAKYIVYDLIYYFKSSKTSAGLNLSKAANDRGSYDFFINYSFEVSDAVIHPSEPLIYIADKKNKKLHSINYQTLEMKSTSFAYEPESIDYFNNEVYATLLKQPHSPYIFEDFKGGLAIVDAGTMKLNTEWELTQDPFDISIDKEGFIYMTSGSGQWQAEVRSYSRSSAAIRSSRRSYHMRYVEAHPTINRVYTVDTKLAGNKMTVHDTSAGRLVSEASDHGSGYVLEGDFDISPDGKYVFSNYGTILSCNENHTLDLNYVQTLDKGANPTNEIFNDFTFDMENNLVYGSFYYSILKYDYTSLKKLGEFKLKRPTKKLFFRNSMLIGATDYGIQIIDTGIAEKNPVKFIDFNEYKPVGEIRDIEKSSDYAKDAIVSLANKGIISGDANGNFNPKSGVTRPQMVKVLVKALGIDTSGIPGTPTFKDVPKSHWAYPIVEAAYREGLINGVDSENFGINYDCTREQIAAILTRALGVTDDILSENSTTLSLAQFSDKSEISSWARKSTAFITANGVMKGAGENKFIPKSTAAREQMALVIYRFLNTENSIYKSVSSLMANKKIRVFLNEDELNLYAFPITQIDPNASAHDHSLIIQENVVMAPVVLLRFLDIEVFENIKPDVITLVEAAPFGNYTSLTMKSGTNLAYMNLQGQDPYLDAEKYKSSLITLPTAPRFLNNHLYIPIIEVSRLLGTKAEWDQRSYAVKIKSMDAPRFPNLRWAPYIIDRMKADYDIKMAIRFNDTNGIESSRMDYTSSGYYDSGEYAGAAAIRTSAVSSSSFNTETKYEVKRYLDKTMGYEYSVKNQKDQTAAAGTISTLENGEILMTDTEYIKGKISLLTDHFYASDLLKKQYNIKVNNQLVDKYSIVLNDRPSIVELLEIKKLPQIDILKPLYEGSIYISDAEAYVFEKFKMEVSVNKSGQIINCTMYYSGYKKNERPITPRDVEEYQRTGEMGNKWNTPFEVTVEADFSNFK